MPTALPKARSAMAEWLEHTEMLRADALDPELQLFATAAGEARNPRRLAQPLRDHYTPAGLAFLGVGAFGAVFRGTHVGADGRLEPVAVKVIYGGGPDTASKREELAYEVAMLLFLYRANGGQCRANLICYRDHFSVDANNAANRQYMQKTLKANEGHIGGSKWALVNAGLFTPAVTEWFFSETSFRPGKDMQQLITDRGGGPPVRDSVAKTARLMRTVAGALAFMHEHRAAHRDIKPGNVQVVNYESAAAAESVLIDVGLACHWGPAHSLVSDGCKSAAGTGSYQPPGLIQTESKRLSASHDTEEIYTPEQRMTLDVYALGATFYEWLSGAIFRNDGVPVQPRTSKFGALWAVVEPMYAKMPAGWPTRGPTVWPSSAAVHKRLREIENVAIAAKQ